MIPRNIISMRSMLQSTVFENPPKSLILQDIWSETTNVTFWVIFKQCAVVVFMVVKVVAKTRARWSGNVFVPLGKKPKASYFLGVEQILFTCINGLEQATQNDVEGGHKPKTTLILRQKKQEAAAAVRLRMWRNSPEIPFLAPSLPNNTITIAVRICRAAEESIRDQRRARNQEKESAKSELFNSLHPQETLLKQQCHCSNVSLLAPTKKISLLWTERSHLHHQSERDFAEYFRLHQMYPNTSQNLSCPNTNTAQSYVPIEKADCILLPSCIKLCICICIEL